MEHTHLPSKLIYKDVKSKSGDTAFLPVKQSLIWTFLFLICLINNNKGALVLVVFDGECYDSNNEMLLIVGMRL